MTVKTSTRNTTTSTENDNSSSNHLMIVASETQGIKVDAAVIAKPFRQEIKQRVQELRKSGIEAPLLVGLLANQDPAAKQYAEWTGRACRADGIRYDLRILDDPLDVERALMDANDDPRVHGILIYYPIFDSSDHNTFSGASQDDYLRDSIVHQKDVEGLCHLYRTNLYRNVRFLDYPANTQKCLLPCTALAVAKILEQCPGCYNLDKNRPVGRHLEGKTITIINRSEIVGRPLAAMLANDGAKVYSIDVNSIYLFPPNGRRLIQCGEQDTQETCVRQSSVVITGVPTKTYRLNTEWIQPHTTVINVASYKNVDEEALLKIPGVVYVPMVGKVTVSMLERNLMRLFENFHHPYHKTKKNENEEEFFKERPWYGSGIQLYMAIALTALLALELMKRKS